MITATSCDLKTVTQNVLIANIPDPALIPPGGEPANPNDSARTNATLWIEPGRYLVAEAGVLLARVTQLSEKLGLRRVGVDASGSRPASFARKRRQ